MNPAVHASTAAPSRLVQRVGFATALFGALLARAVLVSLFASELPFWDQWDAEINALYKPWLDGTLHVSDLFAAHNEHRIFFTRVFGLALFIANEGQFDNLVESMANAVLFTAVLGIFAWPWFRELRAGSLLSGTIAVIAVGAIPYGWENLAVGFQSAFVWMTGWTLLAFVATAWGRADRWRATFATVVCVACCLFTLASGSLAAPVVGVLALLRYRSGDLPGKRLIVLEVVMGTLFVAGLMLIPRGAHHSPLHASDVANFFALARTAAAWPLPSSWFAVAVLWWPGAYWLVRGIRGKVRIPSTDLFYLGVALWALAQGLAVAFARGIDSSTLASRYVDVLALGAAANIILAMRIVTERARTGVVGRLGHVLAAVTVLVVGAYFAGLSAWGAHGAAQLAGRKAHQVIAAESVRAYMVTGRSAFKGKSGFDISYPFQDILAKRLDDATVRAVLPAVVRKALPVDWSTCPQLRSPGTWPSTPPLDGAFGTFSPWIGNAFIGQCTSPRFETAFSHVRIPTSGYLGKPRLSLELRATEGRASVALQRATPAGETWQAASLAVPGPSFVIVLTDGNPEFWFAFGPPVEQGRLSAWTNTFVAKANELVAVP